MTYRPGLPDPVMAHEMWSREICDRLDTLIDLQRETNALLQAQADKPVAVELTEPAVRKTPARSTTTKKD